MRTLISLVGLSLALLVGCGAQDDVAQPAESQLSQAQVKESPATNGSQAGVEKEVLMSEEESLTDGDRFCRDFRCDRFCRRVRDCRGGFCRRFDHGGDDHDVASVDRRRVCRCFGCF